MQWALTGGEEGLVRIPRVAHEVDLVPILVAPMRHIEHLARRPAVRVD